VLWAMARKEGDGNLSASCRRGMVEDRDWRGRWPPWSIEVKSGGESKGWEVGDAGTSNDGYAYRICSIFF